jgi:ABC-type xylose transport system permease subunit
MSRVNAGKSMTASIHNWSLTFRSNLKNAFKKMIAKIQIPPMPNGVIEVGTIVKSNIRQYAMYITLVAIFIVFNIQTGGLFLSSRNISNLILQTGYVAILAIGMTLILIIRHIDLSVGFVAGFTGAVSALLMKEMGVNEWVAILIVLVIGLFIGLYQGTLVAYIKVPAFVVTLAGMFIFRGLLLLVTQGTGSIIVDNEKNPAYFAISNSFIPDKSINFGGYISMFMLIVIIGIIAVCIVNAFLITARVNMQKNKLTVPARKVFILRLLMTSAIIMAVSIFLAYYVCHPYPVEIKKIIKGNLWELIVDFQIFIKVDLMMIIAGIMAVILFVISRLRLRNKKKSNDIKISKARYFVLGTVLISTIIIAVFVLLATFIGFPWPTTVGGHIKLQMITILVGLIAVGLVIFVQIKARKNKRKYDFAVSSTPIFIMGLVVISGIIMSAVFLLATYNGLPWTAVIVGVVLLFFNFILNKTALGRYIYGIGGNPEAAELSGVNVKMVTMFCFASMSTLAALSGIIFTSRIQTAGPSAGVGFELDAIASAFIGGVAVTGGVGKVTNTLIGALVIMSLTSGFLLMNVDISFQYIAKGVIFIIAVAFDVITRKKRA